MAYEKNGVIGFDQQGDDDKWAFTPLTNWSAKITEEIELIDSDVNELKFVIEGTLKGQPQVQLQLPAEEFLGMNWHIRYWGATAIVYPERNAVAQVRTAIQELSDPRRRKLYIATGWIGNDFILPGGEHETELPQPLNHYKHATDPATESDYFALAELWNISTQKPEIGPLLALIPFRAVMGRTDFAVHISGPSGTFKTETAALLARWFNPALNARNAVVNWSGTANALEVIGYYGKDVILIVDDYAPHGSASQVAKLGEVADRLIRSAANAAGRTRLTSGSTLQESRYPRCLILSTGEDIPPGESLRARMINLEFDTGDIDVQRLTWLQDNSAGFHRLLTSFIRWLQTKPIEHRTIQLATRELGEGHKRHVAAQHQLEQVARMVGQFGQEVFGIDSDTIDIANEYYRQQLSVVIEKQVETTREERHIDRYINTLRELLATKKANIANRNGGEPSRPTAMGWEWMADRHVARGTRVGWEIADEQVLFISPEASWAVVQSHLRSSGQLPIQVAKNTLWKRMKDDGLLVRFDEGRERNTIRISAEGSVKSCIAIPLDIILEEEDKENNKKDGEF